jgi:acyl-coenzyme A synthetase/AMP-(fatty) acid ligase
VSIRHGQCGNHEGEAALACFPDTPRAPRDLWWHELVQNQPNVCEPMWVSAEHPLFILYTSGSTGKPKGVQHSSGGYLLQAMPNMTWTFDYKQSDVFWCTADVGWVTGHTYITYGPLAVGATETVFEGVPTYPDDFKDKYYLAGDGANCDLDGYFWIMGRIDDVLNVAGHRLGTKEIESALVANSLVAEAAVVGKPHDIKSEAVVAYVVLKGARPQGDAAKKIAQELRNWVGQESGPIAKPDEIRFGDNLPKTRSGKIMRRLLHAIAKDEEITQDISTLGNPAILEQLKQAT